MNLSDVQSGYSPKNKSRKASSAAGPAPATARRPARGGKGQSVPRRLLRLPPMFEGGQMPLVRRVPKRGFNNRWAETVVVTVNVGDLEQALQADGEEVDAASRCKVRKRFVQSGSFDVN